MLALKNVTKGYGKVRVLSGASFEARPKDCVCIVGEGGAGKSTILKLLARAEDPTSGAVMVDGVDLKIVPPAILQLYRRRLGIAFQEPMLLLHGTVEENVGLPLELFDVPEDIVRRMTGDLMKRLGLQTKAKRLAADLSQSEKSLVGIARAIVGSPMILIADEPLQHLDAKQTAVVVELFKNMRNHGVTIILMSRSAATAKAFGARIVQLKDGAITTIKSASEHSSAHASGTHRILEETEHRFRSIMAQKSLQKTPKKIGGDAKRVRITSIGSDL